MALTQTGSDLVAGGASVNTLQGYASYVQDVATLLETTYWGAIVAGPISAAIEAIAAANANTADQATADATYAVTDVVALACVNSRCFFLFG
ncbi:hypothetical protein [Burkholderia pyrrocinia]|uniref:hypothetical protein n=1 Tax=Burkholderia pyrrocinia TaxID=60550 RepID=UPI0012601961|nr:hypothetical protein [Burkholderia pyrrocinia]